MSLGPALTSQDEYLGAGPTTLPSYADVEKAAERISGVCNVTPILESPALNNQLGGRLLLKAENLQITGSFKLRGAVNRLVSLNDDERRCGVVARSTGNHGLAVAYSAGVLKTHATVVVPASAPRTKIDRIRSLGAELVLVQNIHELAQVAEGLAIKEGRVFVPPADDPWIIAGAGTVGREILQQSLALRAHLDALLICCSGGGLTSGCLLAVNALSPATKVFGIEPSGFEKMARSLAAGRRTNNEPGGHTICDALSGPYIGAIPFEIVRNRLAGALAVTDDETKDAMRIAFSEFGLAVEVALAAVMSGRYTIRGKTVAITVTGRNVDLDVAGRILDA
jgi:threonine dehydratase